MELPVAQQKLFFSREEKCCVFLEKGIDKFQKIAYNIFNASVCVIFFNLFTQAFA